MSALCWFSNGLVNIKQNNMKKLTWMDSPSKTAALEKFQKMKFKIGYPNYYDDDVSKLQRYMNYQVDMNDFYSNIERSTKLKVRLRIVYFLLFRSHALANVQMERLKLKIYKLLWSILSWKEPFQVGKTEVSWKDFSVSNLIFFFPICAILFDSVFKFSNFKRGFPA